MTIKQRQEREAHDRENPWRPMSTAKPSGLICDLLFDDMAGRFATERLQYSLILMVTGTNSTRRGEFTPRRPSTVDHPMYT
ncbi:hypothetical protein J2W42_004682 [Rhizobium tibeticum]|nr:hypothetical protein [Rhizobium tibeticum]